MKNPVGMTIRAATSNFKAVLFFSWSIFVTFVLCCFIFMAKINAYSNVAIKIQARQRNIHRTMADVPLSALGVFVVTVFKVFTVHRNRVTRRPRRPGTASGGIRKLTWKYYCDMDLIFLGIAIVWLSTHESATRSPDGMIDSCKCDLNFRSNLIVNPHTVMLWPDIV